MPSFSEFSTTDDLIHAFEYEAPDTSGVCNHPSSWLVDWSQPIEWNDGTPAEVYGEPWCGQVHVLLDPENLPKGFRAHALRRIDTPEGTLICTNVIAAYGTPAAPCYCHVVNVHRRTDRERMETSETWGMF